MTRAYTRDPLTASERRCSRCGQAKPIAAFRVLRGRFPQAWCKPCEQANTARWRVAKRNHMRPGASPAVCEAAAPGIGSTNPRPGMAASAGGRAL